MGLQILDMARIHEGALGSFRGRRTEAGSQISEARRRRASQFFAEAIHAIEKTHCIASETMGHPDQLKETQRRIGELRANNRQLRQRIFKRKTAEQTLRQSTEHQMKLLQESLQVQETLRHDAHMHLLAQESERKKISGGLRDEIAQMLLGINVRLLSLKTSPFLSLEGLQKEIASTEALVAKSAKSVHRVANDFERGS
jgi:signal transduction histidine kinase